MVKYMYGAWGNNSVAILDTSATTIANLNPFRYRSYYFDTETNLYFLKTRYYDPEIGRFMTIDGISYLDPDSINGLNLYAYCGNNPIMATDPNSTDWWNPFTGNWGEHRWPLQDYYIRPWEVVADYFGGVDPSTRAWYNSWGEDDVKLGIYHMIVATLFGPLSYLFAL